MGLGDWFKRQFVDLIEWTDAGEQTLVRVWPHGGHAIDNGAKLIVREGQAAILLHGGTLADIFLPGVHTLSTRNVPGLARLAGWKHGFESPFKCEVCFISTRQFLDLKWGTLTPIVMRDPDFGAVRVRAYGVYAVQVLPEDVGIFLKEVVGDDRHMETGEIEGHLRAELVAAFTHALGEVEVGVLDLAGDYDAVAERCRAAMNARFNRVGLSLTRFVLQSVSLPDAVAAAVDQRAEANARAADFARGPAGPGLEGRLRTLKRLRDGGVIDEAAYARRRDQILAEV